MSDFNLTKDDFMQLMEVNKTLAESVKGLLERDASSVDRAREEPVREVSAAVISQAIRGHSPSKFDGTGGPARLEDWIREIERVFDTVACPRDLRIGQGAAYLSGKADLWWHNHREPLREMLESRGSRLLWKDFVEALRLEFFPSHLRRKKDDEFDCFVQGDLTVEEYYTKFMELYAYCSDKRSDSSLAARFEKGLHIDIVEKMKGGALENVREVYLRAGDAERLLALRREHDGKKRGSDVSGALTPFKKRGRFEGNRSGNSGMPQFRRRSEGYVHDEAEVTSPKVNWSYERARSGEAKKRVFWCKKCGNNHPGKDCYGNSVKCYACGKMGHRAFECYKRLSGELGDGNDGGMGVSVGGRSFQAGARPAPSHVTFADKRQDEKASGSKAVGSGSKKMFALARETRDVRNEEVEPLVAYESDFEEVPYETEFGEERF